LRRQAFQQLREGADEDSDWREAIDDAERDRSDVELGYPVRYPIDALEYASVGVEEWLERRQRAAAAR
jgi:hypothetical protein